MKPKVTFLTHSHSENMALSYLTFFFLYTHLNDTVFMQEEGLIKETRNVHKLLVLSTIRHMILFNSDRPFYIEKNQKTHP